MVKSGKQLTKRSGSSLSAGTSKRLGNLNARSVLGLARAVSSFASSVRSRSGSAMSTSSKGKTAQSRTKSWAKSAKNVKGVPRKYHTVGRYAGRFRRGKRSLPDLFRQRGFMHTLEVHGVVSDPNCVYVGHSTYGSIQLLEVFMQAMLKKLFQKAGVVIKDVNAAIPGETISANFIWRVDIEYINRETGSSGSGTYQFVNSTTSIKALSGDQAGGIAPLFTDFRAVVERYMTGDYNGTTGSAYNVEEPVKLHLFRADNGVLSIHWAHAAEINFSDEWIHLKSKSELKIQNRTLSATGSGDAEDVTNNPIQGRLYEFSSGCPRTKIPNVSLIASMLEPSGTLNARAAQLVAAGADSYREPPVAGTFWNCSRSAQVMLQPGQIKQQTIYHKASFHLLKFLKKCMFGYGAQSTHKQINLFGKSGMIALEDVINVNSANNISVAYEVNREFGCYLTTKSKNISVGHHYDLTIDNTP